MKKLFFILLLVSGINLYAMEYERPFTLKDHIRAAWNADSGMLSFDCAGRLALYAVITGVAGIFLDTSDQASLPSECTTYLFTGERPESDAVFIRCLQYQRNILLNLQIDHQAILNDCQIQLDSCRYTLNGMLFGVANASLGE